MKKNIKKYLSIITSLLLILSVAYNVSANTGSTVDVSIDIAWDWMNISAPSFLDFWSWTVKSSASYLEVDLSTYSWWSLYFTVEDLRWASSWYTVDLSIQGNIENSWATATIPNSNFLVTLSWTNWIITVLDSKEWTWWVVPTEVVVPNSASIQREPLGSSLPLIQRVSPTTPVSWVLWKYWVQPKFELKVPAAQLVGEYSAVLTMTLVAY